MLETLAKKKKSFVLRRRTLRSDAAGSLKLLNGPNADLQRNQPNMRISSCHVQALLFPSFLSSPPPASDGLKKCQRCYGHTLASNLSLDDVGQFSADPLQSLQLQAISWIYAVV